MRRTADESRRLIYEAARTRFAAQGYDRTTVRAIAADAGIDPAMVLRYFGSKRELFASTAEFDLELPDLTAIDRRQVGAAIARHFVDRWERDESLVILLRAGVTNALAAERMRTIFTTQLQQAVAEVVPDRAPTRAALAASQVLGLALCRYVLRFSPAAALSGDAVVEWLGPTLTRYLLDEHPGTD